MQAPEKITVLEDDVLADGHISLDGVSRRFEWDTASFYKLEGLAIFGDKRIELIEGELIEMGNKSPRHAVTNTLINSTLIGHLPAGYIVSCQNPLKLGDKSVPLPDVCVLQGVYRDFLDVLPETAALVVEIADATLDSDREMKVSLYARFGISEMWIVNLKDRQLEIYRQPRTMTNRCFGYGYAQIQILDTTQMVSPLELPDVKIAVADLLL